MPRWFRPTGLWAHRDFARLWAAQTISIFGTLVTRTALPFTAILVLGATPFQIAALGIAELVPAFGLGLVAGAWVDRLPKRPILIAADLGRALLIATVPLAAVLDLLSMTYLYAVAALISVLTTFFDIAYQSFLPLLLAKEDLVEGNAKLTASGSAAEFAAFGSGGWLVQIFSAPGAMLVDTLTFLWSAWYIARIEHREPPSARHADHPSLRAEIVAGVRKLAADPTLRALAAASMTMNLAFRVVGTVYLLYVSEDLGFSPGALGMIFAVGGGAALLGALVTPRANDLLGIGPVMILMLVLTGIGQGIISLATGVTLLAVVFMLAQQLIADSAATAFEVNLVSLRQSITPEAWLGRVIGSMRVLDFGAMLAGALLGGWLGELVGLRATLVIGAAILAASALWLLASPVRHLRVAPVHRIQTVTEPVTEIP